MRGTMPINKVPVPAPLRACVAATGRRAPLRRSLCKIVPTAQVTTHGGHLCGYGARGFTPQVAGNFHITAGKSIHHARGHSHLVGMVPQNGKRLSVTPSHTFISFISANKSFFRVLSTGA